MLCFTYLHNDKNKAELETGQKFHSTDARKVIPISYRVSSFIRRSYKMDLDFWDCLGRVKIVLQQNFIGLIKSFIIILVKGKP